MKSPAAHAQDFHGGHGGIDPGPGCYQDNPEKAPAVEEAFDPLPPQLVEPADQGGVPLPDFEEGRYEQGGNIIAGQGYGDHPDGGQPQPDAQGDSHQLLPPGENGGQGYPEILGPLHRPTCLLALRLSRY